jgi:cob(I)alamin adenosyltransferase
VAKIYTRSGDSKTTGLLGGTRLGKHSYRIEAIGSLDELNSFVGFLLSLTEYFLKDPNLMEMRETFKNILEKVQTDLFVIGSDLSGNLIRNKTLPHPLKHHYPKNEETIKKIPKIRQTDIHWLEEWMDHFQSELPPLKNFIFPRGNPIGALAQTVRAICRRSERRTVQLAMRSKVNPLILAYLNRLSDLLFLLARAANQKTHASERIWKYSPELPFKF